METIYAPEDLAEVIELTEEPTRFTTLDEVRGMVRDALGFTADADVDVEELIEECFGWYQALDPRTGTITLSRQGFYQTVTAVDFWKAVERHGL